MRRLYLFFYSFLLSLAAYSQVTFHKAFNYGGYDVHIKKHIPLPDGASFIIAHANNAAFILKVDSTGKQLWARRTGTGLEINDAVELPDHDIIITGKINSAISPDEDFDMLLMRIQPNGQLKWSKTYQAGDGESGVIVNVNQNILYLAGLAESNHAMPSSIFLMRLDFNGEVISQGSFFQKNMEQISGLVFYNNAIYISGTGRFTSNTDPILLIADMSGKFMEYHSFPLAGDNTGNAITTATGGVVLSGDNTDQGFHEQLLIHYVADDLVPPHADLTRLISTAGTLNSSVVAADSGYYISGRIDTYSFTDEDRAVLMKIDHNFNKVWIKKYYTQPGDEGFTSLSVSSDGSLTAAGYIDMAGKPYKQILFCKTDGIAGEGCTDTVSMSFVRKFSINILHHILDSGFKQLSKSVLSTSINDIKFSEQIVCDKFPGRFSLSDTMLCAGSCINVTYVPPGGTEYFWEFKGGTPSSFTGKIPPAICYAQSGNYNVTLRSLTATRWDTTVRQVSVFALPVAVAGPDTVICNSTEIRLHATGGDSYEWDPDPTLSELSVAGPLASPVSSATYYVTVSGNSICSSRDSVSIIILKAPDTGSGFDTVICPFAVLVLDARNPGFNYRWSNGQTKQHILPREEGIYVVKISNACHSAEAQFRVIYKDCSPTYYVPSAFTPDGDGLNDIFTASGAYMTVTRMKIFNRWGQKMFESEGKNVSWDGTSNGKKCDGGVYIFLMEIKGADGQLYFPTGTIQLLE